MNRRSGSKHYDVSKRLFVRMLDESLQYSCAYFSLAAAGDLDIAHAPRDVKRAIDFIEAHLQLPLTLADIAGASGVPGPDLARALQGPSWSFADALLA
jgi:AraC-like DNA-binding protein